MMAQLAATTWLVSPVMHQDCVVPRGMRPFPRTAGDGKWPWLVVVGGTHRWSLSSHRQPEELPHLPHDFGLMIDVHIVWRAGQQQRRNGVVVSELPDGLFVPGHNG